MSVKTDRRTQSRKRPLSLVYVELPPSNGGMMRDLNEHGFALRAMMPLQLSEKLPFSISLDNGVRIDGEAIVIRLADNGHVAALEFAGLAAHSRDQIRRWLEKFEEPLAREARAPKPLARASTLEELRQEARQVIAEPPAQHVDPMAAPRAPEPPSPPAQLQQPLPPEPPPPPLAPHHALPVIPPPQRIEPMQPMPSPVAPQTEVAPVSPQAQLEFPAPPAPEPEPPVSVLEAATVPTEPSLESAELPLPKFLRQPENAPPPQLPPLLRLSSVHPGPASEPSKEQVLPDANPPVAETPPVPNPVPLSEILIQPPSVAAAHPLRPRSVSAPLPSRVVPAPLEPLSPWESERDTASPGWMESFTLGRAIGIMVLLTLLAGSVVYHREVGHALIWLGQQIAGKEPQEPSQITQPSASPVVSTPAESVGPANAPNPTSSSQQDATAAENKSAAPSLVPKNPAAPRAAAIPTPEVDPTDSSSGTGQQEYQRAMQILKAPSRKAELPDAVRLLWIAIKKNNVGAEITLAELYHQGRGVAKSCDQTKILLSAAARKGSPDAKRRLREFQREGCRN